MSNVESKWWERLYDDLLAEMLLERADTGDVDATLAFLQKALAIAPGERVFDQCCGIGSLSIPLAQCGFRVAGCDLIPAYIERANRKASGLGVELDLVTADAFEHVVVPPCDAAFNWWTSFGYATSDQQNARMLAAAFSSLRPNGQFALDFMNVPGVLRGFLPRVENRRRTQYGEVTLIRESAIDLRTMAMTKRWSYLLQDGSVVEHDSWVRLYMPNELVSLVEGAGFTDVKLYGGLDFESLTLDSPRCILVARRPA
jgi:SAM-dependent methyltransferase